jgi:hypothetical protein
MSDWADLLDDLRTIRAIFGEAPSLDQVELQSVVLDGPMVKLQITLAEAEFPVEPPEKWRERGFNRACIFLLCFGVRSLEIRGLEADPIFDLSIEREATYCACAVGRTRCQSISDQKVLAVTSESVKASLAPRPSGVVRAAPPEKPSDDGAEGLPGCAPAVVQAAWEKLRAVRWTGGQRTVLS